MMHEGRGKWKGPAGDERDGLWRSGHGPSGQDPKEEQVEGVHVVIPDREEVVRGDVNKDAMQVRHHGREPVKTRIDFSVSHRWSDEGGEPGEGAGWRKSGEQTRTSVTRYHSADEESRNTLEVTGERGEAWSTAHKRPKSEKARPRAR